MIRTGLRQGGKGLLLAFLSITLLASLAMGKAKNVEIRTYAKEAVKVA